MLLEHNYYRICRKEPGGCSGDVGECARRVAIRPIRRSNEDASNVLVRCYILIVYVCVKRKGDLEGRGNGPNACAFPLGTKGHVTG